MTVTEDGEDPERSVPDIIMFNFTSLNQNGFEFHPRQCLRNALMGGSVAGPNTPQCAAWAEALTTINQLSTGQPDAISEFVPELALNLTPKKV